MARKKLAGGPDHARKAVASRQHVDAPVSIEASFAEVVDLIQQARQQVYRVVNKALVDLYWRIGAYISGKLATAEWGDGIVDELARYLARTQPGVRGLTRRNLFRMRQFYDAYRADEVVSALLTQLPWTHHLSILSTAKRPEEREFYVRMAVREGWSGRELERQMRLALFERAVTNPPQLSQALRETHSEAGTLFKDAYVVEFLQLPEAHTEADLHRALLLQLRAFLTELGHDFCFAGSEVPLQVGGRDFALDLLFFHRGLDCLIAVELKVGRFEPEYLGKLEFYLEALDRDVRKPHERPSIGLLLCASKDAEVVEYALSRSLSPALIAEYQTQLPDKQLLQAKLRELYASTGELESNVQKLPARPRTTRERGQR